MPETASKTLPRFDEPFESSKTCSYAVCANRHQWPLTVQTAGCPGCHGLSIALLAQLCPVCNEPFDHIQLRIDVTTSQLGLPQSCNGQFGRGMTSFVTLNYRDWQDFVQLNYQNPTEILSAPDSSPKIYDRAEENMLVQSVPSVRVEPTGSRE